ncbi:MAG: hypothetical protein JXQ83_07810, partial [Candidatus Glassbacteria bacterium]|nr:hypothetical protein [Candidatus Glassbacteria bacterium]
LLKVNLQATDASGQHVSFDADNLPEGAEVFGRGLLKWRPDYDQAGEYEVTFHAFDASANDVSETVTITVLDVNRKPDLVAENQSVDEGASLQFTVAATDPDEDEVSYAAYGLPEGADFTEASGLFDWTPAQDQSGNYVVLFTASDDKEGGVDSVRVVVTVGDVNSPPEIETVADQSVAEGSSLSFEIIASDPDESDQLSVSASGLPEGAELNYDQGNPVTATIDFTPGYLDAGIYNVRVTATDDNSGNPLSVSRSFKLEVT